MHSFSLGVEDILVRPEVNGRGRGQERREGEEGRREGRGGRVSERREGERGRRRREREGRKRGSVPTAGAQLLSQCGGHIVQPEVSGRGRRKEREGEEKEGKGDEGGGGGGKRRGGGGGEVSVQ